MREAFFPCQGQHRVCFGDGGGEGFSPQYILTRFAWACAWGSGVRWEYRYGRGRVPDQRADPDSAGGALDAHCVGELRAAGSASSNADHLYVAEAAQCSVCNPAHETNSKDGGLQLFHIYEGRARASRRVRTKASFHELMGGRNEPRRRSSSYDGQGEAQQICAVTFRMKEDCPIHGPVGFATTSMISMLPPWPTMAISVPLPACFAASTAPIALSSLMPTTRPFSSI